MKISNCCIYIVFFVGYKFSSIMYYLAKVFLVCFITSVCSVFLCLVVRPYDREANCNGEQQEL